jgi:hypothetical protein
MPGSMTGSQLAVRIKRQYPRIVVVVTSANCSDREWSEPILAKPYDLFETAANLAELALGGQQKEGGL